MSTVVPIAAKIMVKPVASWTIPYGKNVGQSLSNKGAAAIAVALAIQRGEILVCSALLNMILRILKKDKECAIKKNKIKNCHLR